VTGARLVHRFLSLATPELTTDGEVDIKVDALARVNFREAWEFVESLAEGERKQDLVKRVIVATLARASPPYNLVVLSWLLLLTTLVRLHHSQARASSPPTAARLSLLGWFGADPARAVPPAAVVAQ
jgi:hypothetical protein